MSWLILYKLCTSADNMLEQSTPNKNKFVFFKLLGNLKNYLSFI